MRAQIHQIISRLQEAAQQLNGFDNLMHETLHGIADDLEAAIRPQWVPVAERLPEEFVTVQICKAGEQPVLYGYRSGSVWVAYGLGSMHNITHWHEIDYPEPPESSQ